MGVVEATQEPLLLAASLDQPPVQGHQKGRLVLRCLNLMDQPIQLNAGTVIGTYTGVEEGNIEEQTQGKWATVSGKTTQQDKKIVAFAFF